MRNFADIQHLVDEKSPERTTIDYKRDAYPRTDDGKRELLKDASSFANKEGGHIVIGVDETGGVPTSIPGIDGSIDAEAERLRMLNIIRDGIQPRIDCDVDVVAIPDGRNVIVLRVEQSRVQPHQVVFQGRPHGFWARRSAGKYLMDIDEIRRAFTLSAMLYEQMKQFRRERVAAIDSRDTSVPLRGMGKAILHLVPEAAFRSRHMFDVPSMPNIAAEFPPMEQGGFDYRLNFDGSISYCETSYTQFYTSGIVESVVSDLVTITRNQEKLFLRTYEDVVRRGFRTFLASLARVGVQPPVWGFLTITEAEGAGINRPDVHFTRLEPIDRKVLLLPEFLIEDLQVDIDSVLRPVFNIVWNAAGLQRSFNYDQAGKWRGG